MANRTAILYQDVDFEGGGTRAFVPLFLLDKIYSCFYMSAFYLPRASFLRIRTTFSRTGMYEENFEVYREVRAHVRHNNGRRFIHSFDVEEVTHPKQRATLAVACLAYMKTIAG
ncbi:MAG: hypothetical protein AABY16_00915 [Nanoarchaeota archaeon]